MGEFQGHPTRQEPGNPVSLGGGMADGRISEAPAPGKSPASPSPSAGAWPMGKFPRHPTWQEPGKPVPLGGSVADGRISEAPDLATSVIG
jgi:hypothetical protein